MAKKKEIKLNAEETSKYYVEVLYFKAGNFVSRKWIDYLGDEAKNVYIGAIAKFTKSKEQVIVAIRDSNHILQIGERLNLEYEIRTTKIKTEKKKKGTEISDSIEQPAGDYR
jgi:hypothetical protein